MPVRRVHVDGGESGSGCCGGSGGGVEVDAGLTHTYGWGSVERGVSEPKCPVSITGPLETIRLRAQKSIRRGSRQANPFISTRWGEFIHGGADPFAPLLHTYARVQ